MSFLNHLLPTAGLSSEQFKALLATGPGHDLDRWAHPLLLWAPEELYGHLVDNWASEVEADYWPRDASRMTL